MSSLSFAPVHHKSSLVIPPQQSVHSGLINANKSHNAVYGSNDKTAFSAYFRDNIISNIISNNWRIRYRGNSNPNSQQQQTEFTQPDISIGNEALLAGLSDAHTIPIGSDYLAQFIDHWRPFSSWSLIRPCPFSSDIIQGLLGNCWFLSALALVAERTELLRVILPTSVEEFERTRQATVRLFKHGQWHSVLVDDVLPVNRAGHLVFSQAKRNQLFVPLIEKALAKLYGGYDRLRGGLTSEGMTSLTGFPCEILWMPPNRRNVIDAVTTSARDIAQQMEEYWIKMVSYNSAGFLIGASCGRSSSPDSGSAADYKQRGLLKEHAYSVLDVVSIDKLRLVKLRNPWGTLVWKGDWSDKSPLWTLPLRKDLVPEGAEEGIFWISFEDLCRYFEMVIVCKIQTNWYKYAFEGRFAGSLQDASKWTVYGLTLDDSALESGCSQAELSATLYQNAQKEQHQLAIFVVVFELLNSKSIPVIGSLVGASVCNLQSAVTCECELRKGRRYLLGVFGFNDWHWGGITNNAKYTLRMHTSKPVNVKPVSPNSVLLGDMITYYVKAAGKPIYRPNVITYQLNNDWAGLISVVENRDPKLWLQVSMRTCLKPSSEPSSMPAKDSIVQHSRDESLNYSHNVIRSEDVNGHDQTQMLVTRVVDSKVAELGPFDGPVADDDLHYLASTRNTLTTRDLIPPGHIQLINVITNQRPIPTQHISIKLNFRFQTLEHWYGQEQKPNSSRLKAQQSSSSSSKDLFHQPPIQDPNGFLYGFHCPRLTSYN